MNQPFGSNQTQNPVGTSAQTPQSGGWAPQPVVPSNPVPVNSVPINVATTSNPVTPAYSAPAPVSSFGASPMPNLTGPTTAPSVQSSGPVMMESAKPKSNIWLFVVLGLIVVGGIIALGISMGWFGGLLGAKVETSPSPTASPVVSTPVIVVNRNDAIRKTDLINLKTALGKYYSAKQSYPTSISISKTSDVDTPLKVLVPDYISSLPVDPLSPTNYYGYKSADGKTFELTAVLEDQSDQAGTFVGNYFLYIVTDYSQETPSTSNPSDSTTSTTDSTLTPTSDVTDPAFNASFDSESAFGSSSSSTSTDGSSADASAITP